MAFSTRPSLSLGCCPSRESSTGRGGRAVQPLVPGRVPPFSLAPAAASAGPAKVAEIAGGGQVGSTSIMGSEGLASVKAALRWGCVTSGTFCPSACVLMPLSRQDCGCIAKHMGFGPLESKCRALAGGVSLASPVSHPFLLAHISCHGWAVLRGPSAPTVSPAPGPSLSSPCPPSVPGPSFIYTRPWEVSSTSQHRPRAHLPPTSSCSLSVADDAAKDHRPKLSPGFGPCPPQGPLQPHLTVGGQWVTMPRSPCSPKP